VKPPFRAPITGGYADFVNSLGPILMQCDECGGVLEFDPADWDVAQPVEDWALGEHVGSSSIHPQPHAYPLSQRKQMRVLLRALASPP
jgi:hypothetical protein